MLAVPFAVLALTSCDGSVTPPAVKDGEDTVISSIKGTPDQNDAKNVLYAVLGKLDSYTTYSKTSSNLTTAKKGIIDYSQQTNASMIKNGDEYYTDSSSKSAFVDMRHVALYKNGKVAYFNKGTSIKNSTFEEYKNAYGVTPNKLLTGQVLNQETVLYGKLDKAENDKYTYTYVLDKEKSNDLLSHQTYMFGSLNGLPTFTDNTVFTLTIGSDYTPISYSYTSKYTINVAVLGEMSCSETCSATFSNINKAVTIPDSDKLNAAMNETPTKIDIDEVIDYGDLSVLVSALLNSDIENGVALSGTFNFGEYQLPVKVKAKIDVNGLIGGGDISKLSNAELILPLPTGNVSILYNDGKIYLDALGNKVVFGLKESENIDIDFEDGMATINDIIAISKSSVTPNTYTVTLKEDAKKAFEFLLKYAGIITEGDEFDFALNLYVTNERIAGVYADFSINNKKAVGVDFLYQDEYFSLPELSDYADEISLSGSTYLNIGPDKVDSKTGKLTNSNTLDVNFTYHTLETDPLKAMEINATFVPSANVKSVLSVASTFDIGMDMPGIVSSLGKADYLDITLKDGILDLYSVAGIVGSDKVSTNEVIYHMSFDLAKETAIKPNRSGLDFEIIDDDSDFDFFDLLDILEIDLSSEKIDFYLDPDFILETIDTLQIQGAITTFLTDTLGEAGSYVLQVLSLNKPISDIRLSIPFDEDEKASFTIKAYNVSSDSAWNPSTIKNNTQINWLKLGVSTSLNDKDHSYDYNKTDILLDEGKVAAFSLKYDAIFAEYEITDEYKAEVDALAEEYNALEKNVQYWINAKYNMSKSPVDTLASTYKSDKSNADNFIKYAQNGSTTANTYYKKLTSAGIDYINALDATTIPTYLESRKASESTNFNALVDQAKAFEWKETENMEMADLLKYVTNASKIVGQKANYVSQNDELDAFVSKVKTELIPEYVKRANEYALTLSDYYYDFELTDELTYEEIIANHTLMKDLAKNYYTTLNNNVDLASCVGKEEAKELLINVTKANYYWKSGLGGYQKSVVLTMNSKMADILEETDSDKAKEEIDTMFHFFNDYTDYRKLCSNYDAIYAKYKTQIDEIDDSSW